MTAIQLSVSGPWQSVGKSVEIPFAAKSMSEHGDQQIAFRKTK